MRQYPIKRAPSSTRLPPHLTPNDDLPAVVHQKCQALVSTSSLRTQTRKPAADASGFVFRTASRHKVSAETNSNIIRTRSNIEQIHLALAGYRPRKSRAGSFVSFISLKSAISMEFPIGIYGPQFATKKTPGCRHTPIL
jgi:hypothetical protein